jgi:hypothetical protein
MINDIMVHILRWESGGTAKQTPEINRRNKKVKVARTSWDEGVSIKMINSMKIGRRRLV